MAIEFIHREFKIPLQVNSEDKTISNIISDDLELLEFKEKKGGLYNYVFSPENIFGTELIKQWSKYYTSDTRYLKNFQKLVTDSSFNVCSKNSCSEIFQIWKDLKDSTNFKEKFNYIDICNLEFLNHSELFLQTMSLYTITSPLLTLITPIIFLIIPFFTLRYIGKDISLTNYMGILEKTIKKIPISNLLFDNSISWSKKIYIIITILFYVVNIYQNTMVCYRFTINTSKIHKEINKFKLYITKTYENIRYLSDQCIKFNIKNYYNYIDSKKQEFQHIKDVFDSIVSNINVGKLMKCYYDIKYSEEYDKFFLFSFGLNGLIDNLSGLKRNITSKFMNICKYSTTKFYIKDGYFGAFKGKNPIKNSYTIKNNFIITGPNASGKTTFIKATLFNILLCQQIGFGFFKKATINPFDHFHCYLNIPDTANRDSLFQAEARRCKEIIDSICKYKKERHFCIFDELYSGTNPSEAISSGYGFLMYLEKYTNIKFMLTTHYFNLCKIFTDSKKICNYNMNVNKINHNFNYTYKLTKGISNIKGGLKVLNDLNYPDEIVRDANYILNTFNM